MAENSCVNQEIERNKRNISDLEGQNDPSIGQTDGVKPDDSFHEAKRLKTEVMSEPRDNPQTSSTEESGIPKGTLVFSINFDIIY